MSDNKNNNPPERGQSDIADSNIASYSEVSSIAGSVKTSKTSQHMSSSSERQIKFERAQRCLENAALVSKRIKEHRKATAELLGRPFEEDDGGDTASELASTMSEKTGYSAATDTSTTLSVQDALNIPGISESLANTLKQKELLMERIKQYKEISKRPMTKPTVQTVRRDSTVDTKIEVKKATDNIDVTQLLHTIKEKDNSLSVIQVKMKAMENTILDLQEKINEKDQIIEAKNKATTLMSDSLSKREKDSLILLEDTRQQMTKMQENFIAMETEWKDEKQKLLKQIEAKDEIITSFRKANSELGDSKFLIMVTNSILKDEIELKNKEILRLEETIDSLHQLPLEEPSPKEKDDVEEEKGSLEIAGMVELTKKVELLEQLNCQIRQTNKELENKLASFNTESKSPSASAAGKRGSPLPTRKGGRNTASKSKSPWSQLSSESLPQETDKKAAKSEIARLEMLVQSLNKDILEKEYVISQKEALIVELQTAPVVTDSKDPPEMLEIGVLTDFPEDNKHVEHVETQERPKLESKPIEDQVEFVKELEEKLKAAEDQIETLHKDMEAANLNMIKVKSTHKLKVKQLQKTIDSFSQVSDAHGEVVRLQQELQDLTRKVAVLEEEKGNLQLHLVDYDSGRLTESDMYRKMRETETLSETRLKAISVLEAQKFDLVQEKDSLILLEDTRQQMTKMQENFIAMETEWKDEKQKLLKQIEAKDEIITSFRKANSELGDSKFLIMVTNSILKDEIELKNKEILRLEETIDSLHQLPLEEPSPKEKDDVEEEKGSLEIAGMVELTKKVELLEQLNCQIRQTNKELENKLASFNTESKSPSASAAGKRGSPLPTRKGGRNTASKSKSPWSQLSSESLPQETDKKAAKSEIARLEMLVQSLNKDILEKEYVISQKEALIVELQTAPVVTDSKDPPEMLEIGVLTDFPEDNKHVEHVETQERPKLESKPIEDQVEFVKELEEKLKAAEDQIETLHKDMEAANLNMIKVKSTHKLKVKQLQKTIDSFSQVSDAHGEVVRLQQELQDLTRKVAVLEEEKGNLQLHLVDYDSGRLTESDMYRKMRETETLSETRLKAISVLEAQKFDLVQELHTLQQKNMDMEDKLADISQLQSEHVCTEMKSVQMEEQIDELTAAKKELELVIENLKLDNEHLNEAIKDLQDEKTEITHKLENYIQENMELTDKLEKLSAEKVSSAESIEIVESLTTQEKLELEEYNKGIFEGKPDEHHEGHLDENVSQNDKNIDSLIEQREDLNKKIELFTQEREEVMEKMSQIRAENDSLLTKLSELNNQSNILQDIIEALNKEKLELQNLNQDLARQIEDLKREKIEIMKETAEIAKPPGEDVTDGVAVETQNDDKITGDKGAKGAKTVKQLTKEILKLKNTIKEREDEIADCQMKILSLEEQQQKQNESLQTNATHENKIKHLTEENYQLKQELENSKKDKDIDHQLLQQELQKVHQEYSVSVGARDARINELENALLEYEKQMFNYRNSLQQKDKELAEYINQVTKLNDVSQKLKSTIELLEEEKAKDQNAELVKTLNKQITAYQKKLVENEDKIKIVEDEKMQLHCVKGELVNKNANLESELKKLKESFSEKQILIKDLQAQQQKHADELAAKQLQTKERDEEIHEIKLQLRKESIENEKLRNSITEKEKIVNELTQQMDETKEKLNQLSLEKNNSSEQFVALETKNKELLEKLKKFAITIKKKVAMYIELEGNYEESQKQLTAKNEQIEQLLIQVETLPALQEKLKHADEEINRLQSQKVSLEHQRIQDLNQVQGEMKSLQERFHVSSQEISQLNDALNVLHKELHFARDENMHLKAQIDGLNKKLVEHEIEQKNNMNLITKISSLEADISQKQIQISELQSKVENYEQQQTQVQYGYDAKVQERDLYIENLEAELNKYKNRICRLEESISVMEDRRHSLERKADQLGSQLQEKQKAYTEYTSQEDELVTRLAALMDHDRVLDKQLFEIDNENKEMQFKVQHLNEDNQRLRKSLSDIQEHYNVLLDKANRLDSSESEVSKYQAQVRDLEANLKKITYDHQSLIIQKKQEIEELEAEFNTQIENAFKEKKILSEKYEKVNEYVSQLENKLQEYKTSIETLNGNVEELTRMNQELAEKTSKKEDITTPDYTEQYISEINRLNSIVGSKSNEIYELNNKIQMQQTNNFAVVSNFETKISELTSKLTESNLELERLGAESNLLQQANDQLQKTLSQKEEQIKELMDNKKLTFEMNIPKTEGMLISSTIEALNDSIRNADVESLDSQIVSGIEEPPVEKKHVNKKITESLVKQSTGGQIIEEPMITPKKAYVCYTKEDEGNVPVETDPFNSDEGWGFGEGEEIVNPAFTHLHNQIEQLKKDNDALKSELQTSNIKLLKALKKLKELKASNEILSNELKTAKQMSQAAFFGNAIEDELRLNIKELEKKIDDLTTEMTKEKRDKESLRKQNEVFHNANDKLTEMKEKLDNEIQLWKYKFKEANDKMSTLQWGGDNKETTEPQQLHVLNMDENKFKDELIKIEKENEELQTMVDQLNTLNQELMSNQMLFQNEIASLNKQLQQVKCDDCGLLKKQIDDLSKNNDEVKKKNDLLTEQLQDVATKYKLLSENYENLKSNDETIISQLKNEKVELINTTTALQGQILERQQIESDKLELIDKNSKLEEELLKLKQIESDTKELLNKNIELEEALRKYKTERLELLALNDQLEEQHLKLKRCENEKAELLAKNSKLEENLLEVNLLHTEAKVQISSLLAELDVTKSSILWNEPHHGDNFDNAESFALAEKCNALEQHCMELNQALDETNTRILIEESENKQLLIKSLEYKEQIHELNIKMENLNSENDNLLSTVAELRSSVSSAVDQRGFEIAELWKQHLAQREADFQKIELELRNQLSNAEAKYEQLLENVQSSSQEETNKLVIMEQVNSLQTKLEDKEEHLRNLQNKYADAMNQLDLLRSEMEDENVGHENKLLEQQEEYEKMIQELAVKNHKHSEEYEETFKNIQKELATYKTTNEELNHVIKELKSKVKESEDKVIDLTNQLRMKESEIYQKTHDYTITLAQRNEEFENVRQKLLDYEKKVEELSYEKESELAVIRLKMHEKESYYEKAKKEANDEKSNLSEALNAKIIECTNLNKQIVDLNRELEENDSTKTTEMQAALENQEFEIIGLKDEIASLQSALRSSSAKIQKHVSFASDTKLGSDIEKSEAALNKDLLDAVPRAELDLALYMLHQRDVRCEELTMELTQLLEERDTLQLRLSDSLRLNEDMKTRFKTNVLDDSMDSSQETISELPSFTVEKEFVDIHRGQSSRSSSVSDADGEKPKLQAKLSELRSVRHSRDVRLRQESEQRQLDLRLLQRDVANLPPEAVDQLAQAHHTLSRDSQSTSTVLLNWLRGKSTPKVVHM